MIVNPCLEGKHLKCNGDVTGDVVLHYDCPCSCHRDPFGIPYRLKWTTEETSNRSIKSANSQGVVYRRDWRCVHV